METVTKSRSEVMEVLEANDNFDFELGTWGTSGISVKGEISQWQTSKLKRAGYEFAFCQGDKLVFKRD